jgi:hypothetical protein
MQHDRHPTDDQIARLCLTEGCDQSEHPERRKTPFVRRARRGGLARANGGLLVGGHVSRRLRASGVMPERTRPMLAAW